MDLRSINLEDFMCEGAGNVITPADPNAFDSGAPAIELRWIGPCIGQLGKGYALHYLGGTEDVALLFNGTLVGFYWGEALAIAPAHQGNALGIPMVLAAVEAREIPQRRKLSERGDKTLRRAWRVANDIEPNPWPIIHSAASGASGTA